MKRTKVPQNNPRSNLDNLNNSDLGDQETKNSQFDGGFVPNVQIENPILNSPYERPSFPVF